MIVDKQVLARIATKWEPNLFGSQWGNLIGGWCVDFFNEYEEPPKKEIEGLNKKKLDLEGEIKTLLYVCYL